MFVPFGPGPDSVLEWAHFSKLTCHPGSRRTLDFIRQHFWCSTMVPDVSAFIAACTVCTQNKTMRQAPAGLLHSVPHRPWSHISLNFVTGLPPSDGNTTILTVVDRFSKTAHFIPLPKLPSAKKTAQLVVQHVFRIHGLLLDMVSTHGPQFSGRRSAHSLGRRPACPPGFTLSLTASRSKPIRTWRQLFAASSPATAPPGASNSCGWNTPATSSPAQPLVSRLSSVR